MNISESQAINRRPKFNQPKFDDGQSRQIFDIDIITDLFDSSENISYATNCLIFKGIQKINGVCILGQEKLFIMSNANLFSNLILYYSIEPIKKEFWIKKNILIY